MCTKGFCWASLRCGEIIIKLIAENRVYAISANIANIANIARTKRHRTSTKLFF